MTTTLTPTRRGNDQKRKNGRPGAHGMSPAARRAYARRSTRLGSPDGGAARFDMREKASRIPFVALIIAMLVGGLALTLLLSTQAAQQAYQITEAKMEYKKLAEEREALRRDVERGRSAPELARLASEEGMIPAPDPAYLRVARDGSVNLIGEPRVAQGAPLPPFNIDPQRRDLTGPLSGSPEREIEVAIPIPVDELPGPEMTPQLGENGEPSETLVPVGGEPDSDEPTDLP
ncbi:hypothetical protein [Hoyosella subflava]|uniref:Possible conserved membrane protein n=1 Tax=Hoyosella subflava (strain DSM 45089 / JCM 17490 / NBRC 109087 / DQS3-9A1) TaxID=443218 RepID=F6EFF9_HOYSD|nr:hypothetical protein [Hoyosella subflava]AEF39772.1 Possible conserved membrane protein [Hoyosella subflava DQS3-9A1]